MNILVSAEILNASKRKSTIRSQCFENGEYLEVYFYIFPLIFIKIKIYMCFML